jgi:hypothetical protein
MEDKKLLGALQAILDYLADDLMAYEICLHHGIKLENHIGESLLILLRFLGDTLIFES